MRRAVITAVVLVCALVAPVGPAGSTAAADPAAWTTLAKLHRGPLPAVSCASTNWCWAVAGGGLLFSADAGASWTPRSELVPADVDELGVVECPTTDSCLVSARVEDGTVAFLRISPAGTTAAPAPAASPVRSISCASAQRCLALVTGTRTVLYTTDGGASWAARGRRLPFPAGAISCVSGTPTCTAVGTGGGVARIARTTSLGTVWTDQPAPGGVDNLVGVDCSSELVCHAGGSLGTGAVIAATTDGGASWQRQSMPDTLGRLGSMSCPTDDVCTAFGAWFSIPIAFRTTNGGLTWVRQSLPTSTGLDTVVSCPTEPACAAVARLGVGFSTANAGAAWQPVTIPAVFRTPSELTCPAVDWCVGTVQDENFRWLVLTSGDGGRTWARHALPVDSGSVSALDCPTRLACHAWSTVSVNGRARGQSLHSEDGGRTWRLNRSVDLRTLGRADLSCLDALRCIAVGPGPRSVPEVRTTADGGLTWLAPARPPGAGSLTGVSCGTEVCVLLGDTDATGDRTPVAWRTTDLAATYEARPLPADAAYDDLDCDRLRCVVVGSDGANHARVLFSGNGGSSWRPSALPSPDGSPRTVACGVGVCVVSGPVGTATAPLGGLMVSTDNASSFQVVATPASSSLWPAAVACTPRRQRCIAADYGPTENPRIIGNS